MFFFWTETMIRTAKLSNPSVHPGKSSEIRGRRIASGDKPKITHMSLRFSLHTGPVTFTFFFADSKMVSARVKTQQNIR